VTSQPDVDPARFDRIAVFFFNALGDHVIALPTLRALSSALGGRFTLATGEGATDLIFGDVRLQRVVRFPIRGGEFDADQAAAMLGPTELFITVNQWHNASVNALLARLGEAAPNRRAPRFVHAFNADPSHHRVDQLFGICARVGLFGRPDDYAQPFPLPAISIDFAARIRAALGRPRLLVTHVETKADKSWPIAELNRAAEAFLDAHPEYAAVTLTRRPGRLADLSPRLIQIGGIPLASASALVASADVFLGVDSFPLHVADLWRIPTLGLFGPTVSAEWGLRFTPRGRHLDGHGSMAAIQTSDVVLALHALARESEAYPRPYNLGDTPAPVVTLRYH
jgi:ADP-heptose:LPS heptosyltransferase